MAWLSCFLALQAFYDGSGKAHDPNIRFVSLGSIVGTEASWTECKTQWMSALEKHDAPKSPRGNRYFHSKEAMHSWGGYDGWPTPKVRSLTIDLLNALGRQERSDPIAMTCSVKLADYRQAKIRIPLLRSPEAICLDSCFGLAIRHPFRDSGIELYFDRKEKFYPILKKLWKMKDRGRGIWWADYVSSITEINEMRDEPGIQVADLLAWLANRYHVYGSGDSLGRFFFHTFFVKTHYHAYFDDKGIDAVFDSDGSMRPGADLPQVPIKAPFRKPTGVA